MAKNRFFYMILVLALVMLCASCGEAQKTVKIDYGSSDIYTKEDMDSAITLILKEFENFKGCTLHSLSYAGDESDNAEHRAWMKDLGKKDYDGTIAFVMKFQSPKEGGGNWNPDKEYTWSWYLARTKGGDWEVLTWGF